METPLKFHFSHSQPPLNNYRSKSPPPLPLPLSPLNPDQQQQQQRYHKHGGSRLATRNLTLRRISTDRIINSLNRSHFAQFIMSDQPKEKGLSVDASKSTLNTKQEPEKSEPIPPPPEKPLPGDCCGSGCVRCVWDIYYEELEEYNNLLKSKSETIADPKSSQLFGPFH